MTIKEIIKELSPQAQSLALTYVPVLSRWVADAGWEAVRRALYVKSVPAWYKAIRKRMTDDERDADDKRAKNVVAELAAHKATQIARERDLLQSIVTMLISALLAEL